MNPGMLDKCITFQYKSGSQVINGLDTPIWASGASTWAEFDVRPPKGQTKYTNNQEYTEQTRWIRMRYRDGITAQMRVVLGSLIFEIASPPIDLGLKRKELYLELKVVG